MVYYTTPKDGSRSLTTAWCFGLACMFAWRGEWALHLAAVAVGTMDALALSAIKAWAKIKRSEIK